MRNERHRRDRAGEKLAARFERDLRARFGAVPGDVGHGDRRLEGRREAARRDLAGLVALAVDDQGALADRLAALDGEADALADRAVLQLLRDPGPARKTALGAATLGQSEGQVCLDRRRVLVEIVAVERQ